MKRFLFLPLFVVLYVAACSAAKPGAILDARGPCGGDAFEVMCSWGGCCPNNYDCTPHGCAIEKPGPSFLGPDVPQ